MDEGNAAEKSFTTLIYPVCAAPRGGERGGVLEEVKWGIKLITTDALLVRWGHLSRMLHFGVFGQMSGFVVQECTLKFKIVYKRLRELAPVSGGREAGFTQPIKGKYKVAVNNLTCGLRDPASWLPPVGGESSRNL